MKEGNEDRSEKAEAKLKRVRAHPGPKGSCVSKYIGGAYSKQRAVHHVKQGGCD